MKKIRYVQEEDKSFWFKLDHHLPASQFQNKIRDKMGYVILEEETPIGLLRYNLFWDEIPFCTMLFVDEDFQHRGYGKKLMEFWEQDMKLLGYEIIMTSTQVDESAQHFYRKLGYQDSGSLIINIPKYKQPMEMFFIKEI